MALSWCDPCLFRLGAMHYSRPDIFSVEHWFGSHWARGSKKQISFKKTAVILKSLDGTEQYYSLFFYKEALKKSTLFSGAGSSIFIWL